MYQTIHEEVAMAGVYSGSVFRPVKFKWGGRMYPVEKITLVSDLRDGGIKQRMYSLMSGGNVYRLLFNRDTEKWWLEEVWCE